SDRLKRSQAIRDLIEQEAIKNYPSPAIVKAVKEYGTNELSLGTSVQKITKIKVTNLKYK
ncbi:11394_t:CDS:1, partial [Ambispora gerdemannii]